MFSRTPMDFMFNAVTEYDPFLNSPLDDFFFAPIGQRQTEWSKPQPQLRGIESSMDWEKAEGQGQGQVTVPGTEQAGKELQTASIRGDIVPRVNMDLVAEKDRYLVKAEIPGLDRENIDLTFHNGLLSIHGTKKDEHRETEKKEGVTIIRKERSMGSFSRTMRLPRDAAEDNVSAKLQNGVLCICIPRTPERTREMKGRIEIQAEESAPHLQSAEPTSTEAQASQQPSEKSSQESGHEQEKKSSSKGRKGSKA